MLSHEHSHNDVGSVCDAQGRTWSFEPWGDVSASLFAIREESTDKHNLPAGVYDGRSGHVYVCDDEFVLELANAEEPMSAEPSLLFIGSMREDTGQLKVRQPEGNYLRICRWDKLSEDARGKTGAHLRTLPQCGCGGSLGVPKLFDSFAEMCIYHYCSFCVQDCAQQNR